MSRTAWIVVGVVVSLLCAAFVAIVVFLSPFIKVTSSLSSGDDDGPVPVVQKHAPIVNGPSNAPVQR